MVLEQKQKDQLKDLFKGLTREVKLTFFSMEMECQYCKLTREMLTDVIETSDKIKLEVHDFVAEAGLAKRYGVDKIPALVIEGEKDYGIRFFGVPAGYEFTTLIEDIVAVGMNMTGVSTEAAELLKEVDQPVNIQVFISPTCPYCPKAVRAAHKLAMASDQITAAMVESSEFPHLVQKYGVSGVPHTMITDVYGFVGQVSDAELAKEVLIALGKRKPEESSFFALREAMKQHEHEHGHEHPPEPEKSGKKDKKKDKKKKKK